MSDFLSINGTPFLVARGGTAELVAHTTSARTRAADGSGGGRQGIAKRGWVVTLAPIRVASIDAARAVIGHGRTAEVSGRLVGPAPLLCMVRIDSEDPVPGRDGRLAYWTLRLLVEEV